MNSKKHSRSDCAKVADAVAGARSFSSLRAFEREGIRLLGALFHSLLRFAASARDLRRNDDDRVIIGKEMQLIRR